MEAVLSNYIILKYSVLRKICNINECYYLKIFVSYLNEILTKRQNENRNIEIDFYYIYIVIKFVNIFLIIKTILFYIF